MTQDNGSRMAYISSVTPFGRAVRAARQHRDWSQEELAAATGIGRRTISRWETGEIQEPLLAQLRALINATGVDPSDILRSVGLLPDDDAEPEPPRKLSLRELVSELNEIAASMDEPDGSDEDDRRRSA